MKTTLYTFRVTDEDGLWGDVQERAVNEASARSKTRVWLKANEVAPRGSLAPRFKLTLLPRV